MNVGRARDMAHVFTFWAHRIKVSTTSVILR